MVTAVPLCAHMFWSTPASGTHEISMPDYAVQGIKSALVAFPEGVFLAHYGHVTNVPDGVRCVDARKYLSENAKDGLLARGHNIAHIADIVRFFAAADHGGWVVDADTLWLRLAPKGLHFATLTSKKSGQRATKSTPDKRGTPFTVPPDSDFARDLKKLAHAFVEKGMKLKPVDDTDECKCDANKWAVNIQATQPLILKHDYQEFQRPGVWFAPVPFWGKTKNTALQNGFGNLDAKKREKYGVVLPSTSEILQESYCVPTSFVFSVRTPEHTDKGLDLSATCIAPKHRDSIIAATFRASLAFQGRAPLPENQKRDSSSEIQKKPRKRPLPVDSQGACADTLQQTRKSSRR